MNGRAHGHVGVEIFEQRDFGKGRALRVRVATDNGLPGERVQILDDVDGSLQEPGLGLHKFADSEFDVGGIGLPLEFSRAELLMHRDVEGVSSHFQDALDATEQTHVQTIYLSALPSGDLWLTVCFAVSAPQK